VVRALAGYLDAHAIACKVTEAAEGRPNLVAHVNATEPGPHLLLCGHTDTVPPTSAPNRPASASVKPTGCSTVAVRST